MSLREIAAELKQLAANEPQDPAKMLGSLASGKDGLAKFRRNTVIDGDEIRITFTQDLLPTKCWHLTVGMMHPTKPLPQLAVSKVKAVFNFEETMELPSLHGDRVRQFVQIIQQG